MPRCLLDASAILAFMSNEPGSARVREFLQTGDAGATVINLSEVAAKLISRGMASGEAENQCRSMGLEIIEVDAGMAFAAAALVRKTQALGLSLGDRICLAAARTHACPAVTADKAWSRVPGITVEVVR